MSPLFLCADGRELYKADISKHHAIFERRDYKTPTEKTFRGMGGLVILMANHQHRELHAHVPPPPKPNPDLMRDIYLHSRTRDYQTETDLFNQILGYVELVAENNGNQQHVEDATRLAESLRMQQPFILDGAVDLRRVA